MASYDSTYYTTKIKEVEDLIEKYMEMVPNTKVKNGQDEMTAGEWLKHYMSLLSYHERKLKEAEKSEGKISSRVRIIRYDMGEGC